jgi:hypothetical protein
VYVCSTLFVPENHQVSCKYVQEGEVAFTFGFHDEFSGLVDAV